jgi:hypothetical protein
MIRPLALALLAGTTWIASPLRALEFLTTSVTLKPKPGAECALARFTFVNRGNAPVHILSIDTACGCTDATADPNDVPARTAGAIEVLFTAGHLTGTQTREIIVHTDDTAKPVRLTLTVELSPARG